MKLYKFSLFLVFSTLLLITAGGLVTSHEAGLAVPDWPFAYGQWFPPMVGNVFWEHGHRMIAGFVGLYTLLFAVLIQVFESRKWVKRLAWVGFGMVVAQAVLGGLTVIYMLPTAISAFHACLAQTFFCLTIALAYFLSNGFIKGENEKAGATAHPKTKRLLLMTTGFVYLQLILGAIIRHSHFTVVPHVVVAFLVVLHVALVVRHITLFYSDKKLIVRFSIGLGLLTVSQFFLGFGAFIFTRMIERGYAPTMAEVFFASAHQTTGAVILGISFLLTLMVWQKS